MTPRLEASRGSTALERCYGLCLALYPPAFRRRFGDTMRLAFRDQYRAARQRGALASVKVAAAAFADVIVSGILERLSRDAGDLLPASNESAPLPARRFNGRFTGDLRTAARRLRHEPAFTAVVVATLALGIGATTTIFSVVEGVLLRPLPYREPNQLLTIMQWSRSKGIEEQPSPANFLDWRNRARLIDLAAAEPYSLDLTGVGDPAALDTWRVSERYFETLGVAPMLGRTFRPEEHVQGRHAVVILSHGLWRTRFGSDPGIVGRMLMLDGEPFQVVGVMPAGIDFLWRKHIWAPKVFRDYERRSRSQTYYRVIGRLKTGVTLAQARDELASISDQLGIEYPRTNKDVGIAAVPLFERMTRSVRPILFLMLGAVGCVLAIACANAANLLLARSGARQSEMAVRTALGASRRDLVRLTLAESLLLTTAAAIAGVLISKWAIALVVRLAPADIPRLDEVGLHLRVVACAVAIAAITALVCGVMPALPFWSPSIERSLRSAARSTGTGSRLRAALVAGQTGLAVVLLVASGLLIRSFGALLNVDLGYRVDHRAALTAHVWDLYPQPERRGQFFADVEARIAQQPGVLAVGSASALPLSHEGSEMDPPFTVAGRPEPPPGEAPTALVTFVTPGYFNAIGMRLVRGRLLTERDLPASPVVVINETMAKRIWPGEEPIGQRITSSLSFAGLATREVVGVVGDVRQEGLQDRPQPAYYVPHRQVPFGSMTIVARTAGDASTGVSSVERGVWAVNPRVAFAGVETLDGLLRDTLAPRRFTLTLLSSFSIAALMLASIGLYGLMSFSVGQRTMEIGIRMALGADVPSVLALVMRQGLAVALGGMAAGLLAALVLTRYLTSMLFGVTATDPLTFAGLTVTMALVSAVACYLPARRAARVDPLNAMRVE